jgi:hypothetical protein
MKKLVQVIVLMLALNFLAVAGGVAWLFHSGHLDRAKALEVKKLLFPPPSPTEAPTTQPADPTTQPAVRLDELLAKASGRTAGEQVDFIQQTFAAQATQLDRRERELTDLQRQVDLAKDQLSRDRAKLDGQQKDLSARESQEKTLSSDKGFQDALQLYTSMPPRQVKQVFMTLSDDVVQRYIQAMEPRSAAKIIKEFKTPEEVERIQRVLEKIRQSASGGGAAAQAPVAPTPPNGLSPEASSKE